MRTRTRVILWALGVIVIFALLVASVTFPAYRDWAFICENTGSRKGYREWCFGLQIRNWYQPSAVELFMQQHFPVDLKHRWTSYAGTGRNLYGMTVLYGHGSPGPIIQMRLQRLDEWFLAQPDSEKRAFFDLMMTGDTQTIQKKMDFIYDSPSARK